MPFFGFQRSSEEEDYLLGQRSEDEGNDALEKSEAGFLEHRSSIPRLMLVFTTLAACFSVVMTVALAYDMIKSKYTGPNLIYSRLCEHS